MLRFHCSLGTRLYSQGSKAGRCPPGERGAHDSRLLRTEHSHTMLKAYSVYLLQKRRESTCQIDPLRCMTWGKWLNLSGCLLPQV